jgi:tetratricopeptide (TPR) repeat protein
MVARDVASRSADEDASSLIALGTLRLAQGQAADARWLLMRAVALRPDLAAGHERLGDAQRRLGELPLAIASYRNALHREPTADVYCKLGNAYASGGALDDAAGAFEAALTAQSAHLAAREGLGHVRLRQGRFTDALRCFRAIAAVDATRAGVAYHTGVALQGLGDERGAAEAFHAALAREPDNPHALNNVCVALLRAGAAEQALPACDRLLARTPATRKALAYRAAALLELGQRDAAGALLDFARLILHREPAPPGYPSRAAFHAELATAILHHPTLRFEPAGKSTRGGKQTGELMPGAPGPLAALAAMIRASVAAYFDHLRGLPANHPYAAHVPARWRLATWAVVLDAHGHQGPHFHPDGFASGVYYVSVPAAVRSGCDHAGWLELGRTRDALGGCSEPLLELVQPRAGLMLMFPSYFYHRTIPFEDREPRISVAFDVLPA